MARRLPVIDEFVEGDESVVFVDGQVVALSALATHVLSTVGTDWTEAVTVASALLVRFDRPPEGIDASDVADATLRALAELGILELA